MRKLNLILIFISNSKNFKLILQSFLYAYIDKQEKNIRKENQKIKLKIINSDDLQETL